MAHDDGSTVPRGTVEPNGFITVGRGEASIDQEAATGVRSAKSLSKEE
jgi:hypothetical protein